ncbi:MAG: NUDIX domain-containing protein [Trueperaceae bacterium]
MHAAEDTREIHPVQSPCGPVPIGTVPTERQLEAFATTARHDGRALVVGAVVTDGLGRAYVQRRSQRRALFPGCWDLVGGHVEEGETVTQALAREIREETGWKLEGIGPVVACLDWEAGGMRRREIDVLVTVDGDLDHPTLEPDKHDVGRWLWPGEAGVLLERREPDDVWVHETVTRAFEVLSEERAD